MNQGPLPGATGLKPPRGRPLTGAVPGTPDRVGRWEPVQSEWVFRSGFVSFRRDHCRLPDGRLSPDMYFMELRDFAMTVAVTPGGEVLLSREYKHGAGDVAHTLPAGFIEAGEAPDAAARRELREETGHDGEVFEALGSVRSCFRASRARVGTSSSRGECERVAATNPDEFEEIEVVSVPVEELRRDLAAAAPRYVTDANSALALELALAARRAW